MKKTVSYLSVILLLAVLASACGGAGELQAGEDAAAAPPMTAETPFVEIAPAADDSDSISADNGSGFEEPEPEPDTAIISNIQDYRIIYPQDSIGLERVSAFFLSEYIYAERGILLDVSDDSSPISGCEILIGGTNRELSQEASELEFAENELLIRTDGEKIIIYGEGVMVAGAMGQFASRYIKGAEDIKIQKSCDTEIYAQDALRNAIVMICDGMGVAHVELAKASGLETFKAELLPNIGSLLTECYPGVITDSAAAATALSSGYKTRYTYIGVDKDGVSRQNIRELAYGRGYKTAVVSTDTLEGATPASYLAHIDSRYKTAEISAQIAAVANKEGDMLYSAGTNNEPILDDVKAAFRHISAGGSGFFIMIEEDRTDYHAHYHEMANLVACIERFDESVAYAIAFAMAHPGTLLIITSDHETGGLTQRDDGSFTFTGNDHTKTPVPIYAWGAGTDVFNNKETENTEVAKFVAKAIFGVDDFGVYDD